MGGRCRSRLLAPNDPVINHSADAREWFCITGRWHHSPRPSQSTRQRRDHTAFGNPPKGTFGDHPFQFGLQRNEAVNPPLNLSKPGASYRIRRFARLIWIVMQRKQGSDGLDLEPQLTRASDESKSAQVSRPIQPPVVLRARRLWQEADQLVIADRRHLHPRSGGWNAYRHI